MISAAKQKGCSVPAASSHQTVGCGPLSGQQPLFSRWAALKQAPLAYPAHVLSSPTCCFILLQTQDGSGKFIKPRPICLMSSLKLPGFFFFFCEFTWVQPTQMALQCPSAQQLPSDQQRTVPRWWRVFSEHCTNISGGHTKMKSMCSSPLY